MRHEKPLTEVIRDAMRDWNAATPEQRERALSYAAEQASKAEATIKYARTFKDVAEALKGCVR